MTAGLAADLHPAHDRARAAAGSRALLGRCLDLCIRSTGRLRFRSFDPRDAICISGMARGGTTWLAEVLASDPCHLLIFEPLQLHSGPEPLHHGFNRLNYHREGDDWSRQITFLENTLHGYALNRRTLRPWWSVFTPHRYTRLLVKFVNANMLLPLLHRSLGAQWVMLIRHPCAVVSSQIRWGAKDDKRSLFIPPGLFEDFPLLEHVFDRLDGLEDVLAFKWAMQQVPALSYPKPYPWLVGFYEWIYHDRFTQLTRLCNFFGIDGERISFAQSYKPSSVTMSDSSILSGEDHLRAWKRRLHKSAITRILDVVHACGIDVYSDSEMPVRSIAAELEINSGAPQSAGVGVRQ